MLLPEFKIVETTEQRDGKEKKAFALVVNGHEIGVSKTDVDARFHMHFLQELMESVYTGGYDYGYDCGLDWGRNGDDQ